MKKLILSLLLLFSLVFSGCSQKEYIYVQQPEYKFKTYQTLDKLSITVDKNNYKISDSAFSECGYILSDVITGQVKPYVELQREIIQSYEGQIEDYNTSINKINKDEK